MDVPILLGPSTANLLSYERTWRLFCRYFPSTATSPRHGANVAMSGRGRGREKIHFPVVSKKDFHAHFNSRASAVKKQGFVENPCDFVNYCRHVSVRFPFVRRLDSDGGQGRYVGIAVATVTEISSSLRTERSVCARLGLERQIWDTSVRPASRVPDCYIHPTPQTPTPEITTISPNCG